MRVEFLESFLRFVTACQAEIQCCAIPVRRLIARHKDDGKTWALCHAFCEQGEPFHQAWKNAVLQGSKGQGVSKKDVQLLLDFGDTLGESETESFRKLCTKTFDLKAELMEHPIDTLSDGERKKIYLALAFSLKDKYLLLDEPTNHLDANAKEILATIAADRRKLIIVTHDTYFLEMLRQRVKKLHVTELSRKDVESDA